MFSKMKKKYDKITLKINDVKTINKQYDMY